MGICSRLYNRSHDGSGITSLYSNFFANSAYIKYWDKYTSTIVTQYNNRILGDATGEMVPFESKTDPDGTNKYKSSWYGDYAYITDCVNVWLNRGGGCRYGTISGMFSFNSSPGNVYESMAYRIVLTPSK